MKKHLSAIGLAAAMLLGGALLAFLLHQEVKGQVLSQFNESQLLIAQQAARHIESYFDARSQDVRYLSSLTSLQHLDAKTMSADIQATFTRLKTARVEDIAVLDAMGQIVYSTAEAAIVSGGAGSDIDAWAKQPVNRGAIRLVLEKSDEQVTSATGAVPKRPAQRFVLVTPLNREAHAEGGPEAGVTFVGTLLLTVDLKKLAEETLGLTPTKRMHPLQIWAMDESGTVLLQSEHPEMVLRSIRTREETCNQCHVSFDYAEKMLTAKQGTLEYQLRGQPGKVAAFAPMTFAGASWIIVVNAPRDEITSFIRANSVETWALFGVVGIAVGFTFFSVYRSSAEANYRAIFDTANDAIFVHDAASGAIVDVNRRMSEMYGYTREEALHLTVQDVSAGVAPHTQERALELAREAVAGTPQLFEWLAKDRGGRLFWVEVNLRRVIIGDRERLLAIVRDISERKRAEQSLREADEQLREQATLVKLGEMAAVVAHEVRNPLAAVRGAIQVIGHRLPPGKDATVVGEIIARLDALDELMKDLLLFARPPQVRPVPVDITTLAKETSALVSQDPTARDVRFEIEGSTAVVMADPQLLQIVLLNLFLNAAHAIQSTGTIRTLVAVSDGVCRIAIADTGPGIPPEIRDRIFAPFFTTKSRGTGLGLSTAKRLVESHHGCISVQCPPEGGTIVTIELPGEQPAQNARD